MALFGISNTTLGEDIGAAIGGLVFSALGPEAIIFVVQDFRKSNWRSR
jgi:hypothetical protein